MDGIKLVVDLLPSVAALVKSLIEMGKTQDEATAIVKRDLKSRHDEYLKAKAEDDAALDKKHGRD